MAVKCERCGGATKVTNTRHADSNPGPAPTMVRLGEVTVGWYTPDWVIRIRRCTICETTRYTVELPVEDLEAGWLRLDGKLYSAGS